MANTITDITLCRVPITPVNQLDFSSESDQQEYFSSKARHTYNDCSYQPRTGIMRVKGYVDELRDCNYGYYKNTYKNTEKTYYFWIVAKDYITRETTQLTIQIDVFQTWQFNFNLNSCLVEREHVDNDAYGMHTIKEDFELGDYLTVVKKPVSCLTGDVGFFVAHTDVVSGETMGGIYGSTYNGCHLKYFSRNGINEMGNFIEQLSTSGKGDTIAYIFQFPSGLAPTWSSGDNIPSYNGVLSKTETFYTNEQVNYFAYNGITYTPYNKKLLCYPYMFITVKNPSGGNVVLKFENFVTSNVEFLIEAVLTQHPTISCTPLNYGGKAFAIDDSITLNDYGLCSWNNDNFANWFAQHKNTISAQSTNAYMSTKASGQVINNNYDNAISNRDTNLGKGIINTSLSTLTSLGSGNLLGAGATAIGGAANTALDYKQAGRNANNDLANSNLMNDTNYQNEIRSIMASVQDASVQPNTCKGSTESSGLDIARNTATFFIEQTAIKPEYAKMIDSYFQMFGYQVNAVKVPNYKSREKWNYLKTVNASVYGDVPFDDCSAINNMFNNGLTIWHDESYMYEYDTLNTIR